MPELGEVLLDRIEIGAVWREENEMRTSGPDRLSDGRFLVAGEISMMTLSPDLSAGQNCSLTEAVNLAALIG